MRNLIPNQYYLRNPHTGAPLDPLLSFRAQRTTEFELQDCNPFESNLNCLINITDPIQWPSTDNSGGLCLVVKPQLCTGRSTTISPRTRSSPLPPRHSSQNSQPTLDNWSISGTSSMKPKPTDRRSLLDITWSGQSRTPPSTIFNLRCRKKRRAPPPPPSALQSRTRLDKEKVQLSRSWHDLVRKSSSPQPVKSTTSVYLNTSLIDAQSGFINSDKALNTALDSGTITTTSIGFCTATRTRTLVECPQLGIEVFRAHTLPRARVKSRTGHEPCIESVLAQSKLNGLSDSMLAKAVRFSGTEQNGDHLTIVPWLSETANKLETLRSPNVARNSSIKPMKDVVERSTRMHRSSLPSDLNTENETEEEKLDTMQTSENVIVHEQHLPQTAVGIPVQNKPSPAVAERPSKDLVATYICKRFSSQSSAPVSPSNVNATSQAVGAQYPNCFMSELNEVISRIRHVES
ncbi:unnamed protein product [Echinostoma caproni]|uniref:Uncharacterized protein n=1 Tax=Echinostoma caproni TaxID=27848 RepID=A0A183A7B0_9TREM|nr:unnamed protein product [Echinostoma caproni]